MDVIATAMASSLGYDVATACAAARAGLVRRTELPFMILEGDASPGLAVGHPASLLGGSFEGDGRLARLLEGAFRDLMAQRPIDSRANPKLAFYLAIPRSDRERQGLNLIHDDDVRADYIERLGETEPVDEFARAAWIVETAVRLAGFPIKIATSPNALRVAISGHAAVIELYQQAQHDFEAGRIDVAIVAGVDSLVTPGPLNWLSLTHRLKGAEAPAGLFPGEAAALVVLRGTSEAATASSSLARIDHVVRVQSPTRFLEGQTPDGLGQFQVLRTLRAGVGTSAGRTWFVVDQNGEVFRASDWGCSLVRLHGPAGIDSAQTDVWYSAAGFGDVGAASGAVTTCMAVRAFERRYAPSPHALVITSSDGAERAGCAVSSVEH